MKNFTFSDAITIDNNIENEARTQNNMKANKSSFSKNVDLFFKIGSSRGKDLSGPFLDAINEDWEIAVRVLQWARDIRGGAGERQTFRDLLLFLEKINFSYIQLIIDKIPEIGRWDDMMINFESLYLNNYVCEKIKKVFSRALSSDATKEDISTAGLLAKWCPRKGEFAKKLRNYLKLDPKKYRKLLVHFTDVVENKMCAGKWDEINFSHVPSVASSMYKKAFVRRAPDKYEEYITKLLSADKSVKINAGAIFPHDVIKDIGVNSGTNGTIIAQWDALPNYLTGVNSIIPVVDVSGSMENTISSKSYITAMDVAVALGLYVADKNEGVFKDIIVNFSEKSELLKINGNIVEKYNKLIKADWGYSTNLHAVFDNILELAKKFHILDEHMPKNILILSDMQFNKCVQYDDSAIEMIKRKYNSAGYKVPNVIFWNIIAYDNIPVKFNDKGVALISGYSPAILTSLISEPENMTPEGIMLKTIMKSRYDLF